MKFQNPHKSSRTLRLNQPGAEAISTAQTAQGVVRDRVSGKVTQPGGIIELTEEQLAVVAQHKGAQALLRDMERVRDPNDDRDHPDNDPEWLKPKEAPEATPSRAARKPVPPAPRAPETPRAKAEREARERAEAKAKAQAEAAKPKPE